MVHSFWGWGALAFGLGSGLTAGLTQVDHELQNSFQPNTLFGSTANDVIGWTLSPYVIGGVSLFTWIGAHAGKKRKLELTARAISEALLLSMGISTIAKFSFNRTRPDGGGRGFPSGHATAIFTAAGVITSFYGWKGALPSYALASVVSLNRIDSYNHFLSDVVMGAVLGSVIGYGAGKFHKKEHPNFFLTSKVTHDGATLQFVRQF
jgi:membrane-associated phospholipid phosphatase